MASRHAMRAVASSLSTLPPSVAHQVLDDLRAWDILRLASYDAPNVKEYILAHKIWGLLFNREIEVLNRISQVTLLYWEICVSLNIPVADVSRSLDLSYSRGKLDHNDVETSLYYRIVSLLETRNGAPVSFERYAPNPPGLPLVWDYSTLPALRRRWETLKRTQEILNKAKSSQLERLAALLEDNPDILKRTRDPTWLQRPNIAHRVKRLRAVARKIKNDWTYSCKHRYYEEFRYPFLPIIPFDHALESVVCGLAQHMPHPNDLPAISTFLQGMKYIYVPEKLRPGGEILIYRTVHTPYSAPSKRTVKDKPQFQTPYFIVQESWSAYSRFMRCNSSYEPHDEREIEWLEAFVAVYRYFEKLHA